MNLVCPLCRGLYDGTFRFWRLKKRPGLLRCSNPVCEGRFVTAPYPIVMPNPARALERMLDVPEGVSIPALGMMLRHLSESSALFGALCDRSTAVWGQYHDFLPETFRPEGIHPAPFGVRALGMLDALTIKPGARALVAGCGPGREALELAARLHRANSHQRDPLGRPGVDTTANMAFPEVIALDHDTALLQTFHQLIERRKIEILLRASIDRWHTPEVIELPRSLRPAIDIVHPVCADILDPPFEANSFDLTVALNLLDRVAEPLRLLGQLQAMTRPGGHILLSSPFAWESGLTPRDKRLSSVVPHARLADNVILQEILTGQIKTGFDFKLHPVAIMDPIQWALRTHDTHAVLMRSHVSLWKKPD